MPIGPDSVGSLGRMARFGAFGERRAGVLAKLFYSCGEAVGALTCEFL